MAFFNLGKKPKQEEKPAGLSQEQVAEMIQAALANKEADEGKLSVEQKDKITQTAKKLGKECLAQECFDKELSYTQSLEHVVEQMVAYADTLEKQFSAFNSDAGNEGEIDSEDEVKEKPAPKTPGEAVTFIVERDGIKRKEALAIAKVEFAQIFKDYKGAR